MTSVENKVQMSEVQTLKKQNIDKSKDKKKVQNKKQKTSKVELPTVEEVSDPNQSKTTNPNQFLCIYYKNKVENKYYKLFVRRSDKTLNEACLYRFEGFDEVTGNIKLLIEQAFDINGKKCVDRKDVRYSIKFEPAIVNSQRIVEDLKLKNIEMLDDNKIFVQKDRFIMKVVPNSIFGCSRYNRSKIFAKTDRATKN